jgi:hypothetical protein
MTITIRVSTRGQWVQQTEGELCSLSVCVRLERIAAGEVTRLGRGRNVTVSATNEAGEQLCCVWPADAVSYWTLRGQVVTRPWETVPRPLAS